MATIERVHRMQRLLAGTIDSSLSYYDYVWIVKLDDYAMTGQVDLVEEYYNRDTLGLDWSAWKDLYRQAVGNAMRIVDDVTDSKWDEVGLPCPTLEELGL